MPEPITTEPKSVAGTLDDLLLVAQNFDQAYEATAVATCKRFCAAIEATDALLAAMDRERVVHENIIKDLDAAITSKKRELAALGREEQVG